jgi:hypothetical protein
LIQEMAEDVIPEKICTVCNKPFPATSEYFYKESHPSNLSTLRSKCKKCWDQHSALLKRMKVKKNNEDCIKPSVETIVQTQQNDTIIEIDDHQSQDTPDKCGCGAENGNILGNIDENIGTSDDQSMKTCTGPCGRSLPHTSEYFYEYHDKRRSHLLRRNNKCKQCWNIGRPKRTSKNPKTAMLSDTPVDDLSLTDLCDQCGACGTRRGNIRGDVNDTTGEKYGYLCTNCYRLASESKGDLVRMRNVITYLEKTRQPSDK